MVERFVAVHPGKGCPQASAAPLPARRPPAFERRYVEPLARVRRWSLDRTSLLLQDGRGRTLLLFRADTP